MTKVGQVGQVVRVAVVTCGVASIVTTMSACAGDSAVESVPGAADTVPSATQAASSGAVPTSEGAAVPSESAASLEALTWPCLLTSDEVTSVLGPHQDVETTDGNDYTCTWYAEGATSSQGPSLGLSMSQEGTGQNRLSEPFPAEEIVTDTVGTTAYYNPNGGTLEFLCQPDRSCILQFGSGYDSGTSPVIDDPDALRGQVLQLGKNLNERINEPQGD